MPQGEQFWNPYRWVTLDPKRPIERKEPTYHHQFRGCCGRIWCELETLTPLVIGDGQQRFIRHKGTNRPYIPGTSLKGAIRSLAEVVGNGNAPFDSQKSWVDFAHAVDQALWQEKGKDVWDIVSRTFGYLHARTVFAGLIRFSDAELVAAQTATPAWPKFKVAVGQPKPDRHKPFYPNQDRRKFYHHIPGTDRLTPPHPGIKQTTEPEAAPPGTRFAFTVDFENLRKEELALLVYCLILEEEVTVELSPAALGKTNPAAQGVILKGPLRHKIGGCKPHGGGSVRIQITKLLLREDPAARYRGGQTAEKIFEGPSLAELVSTLTEPIRNRSDRTMKELRAMLIYTPDDPRRPINYPTYQWFQDAKRTGQSPPLKPTI